MMYKYEIHCHTKEVSGCSIVSAEQLVKAHKEVGFTGICITDHYYDGYFDMRANKSDKEIVTEYLSGYHKAVNAGKQLDLIVLQGMEIRFKENVNDYLLFGITEQFLYENPRFFELTLEEFSTTLKTSDMVIIWAHPFRDRMTMINQKYIDGVEIVNGNSRHDSRNYLAKEYAKKGNLFGTCGSDYHQTQDLHLSPMKFFEKITDMLTLVSALKNNRYTITNGKE